MKRIKRGTVAMLLMMIANSGFAQCINGNVVDKKTGEPLIGATVQVEGCDIAAVTDASGNFNISGLKNNGAYNLFIKNISYQIKEIDGVQSSSNEQDNTISVALKEDEQQLGEVAITAVERKNTEVAMVQLAKNSSVIVSNILTVGLRVSIPSAAMHLTGA